MEFIALDVETANSDMASICQIGAVRVRGDEVVEAFDKLVDPEDYFDSFNVEIHGIDEQAVADAPCYGDISSELAEFLRGGVVVTHTGFDRVAIRQAAEASGVSTPDCVWLDSARVVRRTWEEFAWKGYGLANVCRALGYEFRHHDALEDAKAAAYVMLAAFDKSGIDLDGWLTRVEQPIDPSRVGSRVTIGREGNPEGALFGEVLVFTGELQVPRRDAADMAAKIGCQVAAGVTKKTTLLVVGDQDIKRLAGHEKVPSTARRKR